MALTSPAHDNFNTMFFLVLLCKIKKNKSQTNYMKSIKSLSGIMYFYLRKIRKWIEMQCKSFLYHFFKFFICFHQPKAVKKTTQLYKKHDLSLRLT